MKKLVSLILVLVLLLPASMVSAASLKPDPSITVFLNDEILEFDIDPIQTQGTTFVQFTTIFKALGLQYTWDGPTKTIYGYNSEVDLYLTIGDRYAIVNDNVVELPVAPFTYDGRTLVPLRFIGQSTGLQVDWDGATRMIDIYDKGGSAPSKPAPTEDNLDVFLLGTMIGDNKTIVKGIVDLPFKQPYGDTYLVYDGYELFGYDTELNFEFIYNELSSISYMYGKSEAIDNPLIVMEDFVDGVSSLLGKPDSYVIYDGEYDGEGGAPEVVDWDIPVQLLYNGIEEGDYTLQAEWDLADAYIMLTLYKAVDGTLLLDLTFSLN